MWEDKTTDNVLSDMLGNISNAYEKTIGYPTHDITKASAIEVTKLYIALKLMMDKLDVDKLTGDELNKYVLQRKGIKRKLATFSKGIVTANGNGQIEIGDLFETQNGVQFQAVENVLVANTADVKVQAIIAGSAGNVGANAIVLMPKTLAGIISVNNGLGTYDGYDEESDDNLRERYYAKLQEPATSGNIYHYKQWAKEITGVGDAKVFPLWNGDNTVKVIIIDSNKQPAIAELVQKVQNYIDPKEIKGINTWGTGAGEAPIGAYCTIVSATSKPINILVDITPQQNYTERDLKDAITKNITEYLKSIAFQTIEVSYAKIGSIILSTIGVADYKSDTYKLNGSNTNVILTEEEIPVIGSVVVS